MRKTIEMTVKVKGISHITLICENLNRLADLFREHFQCEESIF